MGGCGWQGRMNVFPTHCLCKKVNCRALCYRSVYGHGRTSTPKLRSFVDCMLTVTYAHNGMSSWVVCKLAEREGEQELMKTVTVGEGNGYEFVDTPQLMRVAEWSEQNCAWQTSRIYAICLKKFQWRHSYTSSLKGTILWWYHSLPKEWTKLLNRKLTARKVNLPECDASTISKLTIS